MRIVNIPQNHLLLDTDVEIFVSILLMLVASSAIGLLISAIFKSGESAILVVLVLMIGQVVFSGIMFTLTGVAARIAAVVVCRWGMGALGASTDLNSRLAWLEAGLRQPYVRCHGSQPDALLADDGAYHGGMPHRRLAGAADFV